MNYILDTHIFLWSLFNSKKLSDSMKKILVDVDNEIYVSLISFWEVSLKYNLGKIELDNYLPDDLPGKAKEAGFNLLSLHVDEVATFYRLPKLEHRDPFDRLLIWQTIKNEYTLLSRDPEFARYKEYGLKTIS